jgi:hypothetical protein
MKIKFFPNPCWEHEYCNANGEELAKVQSERLNRFFKNIKVISLIPQHNDFLSLIVLYNERKKRLKK